MAESYPWTDSTWKGSCEQQGKTTARQQVILQIAVETGFGEKWWRHFD